MPITIFSRGTNAQDVWLQLNDDGTLTYHTENNGWMMMQRGLEPRDRAYTAEKAKEKWPRHSGDIDEALRTLAKTGPSSK